jgi:hypothetical protein
VEFKQRSEERGVTPLIRKPASRTGSRHSNLSIPHRASDAIKDHKVELGLIQSLPISIGSSQVVL